MPEIIVILLEEDIVFILLISTLIPIIPIIEILCTIIIVIKEIIGLEINLYKWSICPIPQNII